MNYYGKFKMWIIAVGFVILLAGTQSSRAVAAKIGNDTIEKEKTNKEDEFDRVDYRYKGHTIQYYMNHPDSVKQKTLDGAISDYIEKSNDIGAVFTVIDYLSTDAIDSIAESYIENKKDYGMYYSFENYLSTSVKKKLKKYVDEQLSSCDQNMSKDESSDSRLFQAVLIESDGSLKNDMTGNVKIKGSHCSGNLLIYDDEVKEIQTVKIKYNLKIKSGDVKLAIRQPNNIVNYILEEEGKGTLELSLLNGMTEMYLVLDDASFTLNMKVTKK